MWGVYPEAMAWNVGAVHSKNNLGERIWRSSPKRANLKVHFEICPLGATSTDTLTQIGLGNLGAILGILGQSWVFFGKLGGPWAILGIFGQCRAFLGNLGRSLPILSILGRSLDIFGVLGQYVVFL